MKTERKLQGRAAETGNVICYRSPLQQKTKRSRSWGNWVRSPARTARPRSYPGLKESSFHQVKENHKNKTSFRTEGGVIQSRGPPNKSMFQTKVTFLTLLREEEIEARAVRIISFLPSYCCYREMT